MKRLLTALAAGSLLAAGLGGVAHAQAPEDPTLTGTAAPAKQIPGQKVNFTATLNIMKAVVGETKVTHTFTGPVEQLALNPGDPACTVAGMTVTCAYPNLPVGAKTPTVIGTVKADAEPGSKIVDKISATVAGQVTPAAVEAVAEVPEPKVKLTLDPATLAGKRGAAVTAKLTVENTGVAGDAPLTKATVDVALPGGLEFKSATGCTASGAKVSCTPVDLAPAAKFETTLNLAVKADANTDGNGDVVATVATPKLPSAPTAKSAFKATFDPSVIEVHVTADKVPTVTPGKTVTYKVKVKNKGGDQNSVTLKGILPGQLKGAKGESCVMQNQILGCNVGALKEGAEKDLTITADVKAGARGARLTSVFTVMPGDKVAEVTSAIKPSADMKISGKVGKLRKGKKATYTFAVQNAGPSNASKASAAAKFTSKLKVKKVSGKGCKKRGNGFTCSWSTMKAKQKASVKVSVTVARTAKGTLTVTGTTKSSTSDPSKANNTAKVKKKVTR